MTKEYVLEIKDLKTTFITDDGDIPAVDGVSFNLKPGETLGIVGESGSGKSVTSLSIMGLIPTETGMIQGDIKYNGNDITKLSEAKMRKLRGNEIAMIFQEPMTSLNPVFTIGNQLMEAILLHMKISKKDARDRAIQMLKLVGIPRAEEIINEYPHQLSGGMRQRVMIAMAMSCDPAVLIADEPTTALDVTIQAQILELMKDLKKKSNTSILLITHDLGVVAEMCEHVIVMYAGKVVEEGDVKQIFHESKHPYTIGLLRSIPKITGGEERLYSIPGNIPNPQNMPIGCSFVDRCDKKMDICSHKTPELIKITETHSTRCWLYASDNLGGVAVGE